MKACMQAVWNRVMPTLELLLIILVYLWVFLNKLPWYCVGVSCGFIASGFSAGKKHGGDTTKFLHSWLDSFDKRLKELE